MVVLNDMDRFHLAKDVIERLGIPQADQVVQLIHDKLIEHKNYIRRHGDDMPDIRDWRWGAAGALVSAAT